MKTLNFDECNYVNGAGCGDCYLLTSDNEWVYIGKFHDKWVGARYVNFCEICTNALSPHRVECYRIGSTC